jgi:reactive chlorine resistance protein C
VYQVTDIKPYSSHHISDLGRRLEAVAPVLVRYAMVVVMFWFGGLKFTAYEAQAIQGLVANSPFLGWLYGLFSVDGLSYLIGTVEIAAGILIAARAVSAKLSALGGLLAVGTFVVTLSFFFSTPGVSEMTAGGFPVISVLPGQFLLKDLALLAVSFWIFAEGLRNWDE